MPAADLEPFQARLRAADLGLLRALAARARLPREPRPVWGGPAAGAPPLAELICAVSPAGAAADAAAERANGELGAGLRALQARAAELAEAKFERQRPDSQAALEIGDRARMETLLADLPADLRRLDAIRAAAERTPGLPPETVGLLWREYVIPWTRRIEIAHLMDP
ncbi:MAG: hypothetical protein AB7V22_03440 [Kiritimatiellia bacterium]